MCLKNMLNAEARRGSTEDRRGRRCVNYRGITIPTAYWMDPLNEVSVPLCPASARLRAQSVLTYPCNRLVLTVWASALATFGCGRSDIPTPNLEVIDSAGVRITSISAKPESLPQWTLEAVPSRVLTGMETGDSGAFAFVGSVRWLSNGALVVGDVASGRLLIYDSDGRYVRALGRRGDGPGEFRRQESITVGSGDTLTTFDPSLRRLSFWHPETGFVKSVNLSDGGSLAAFPTDAWHWRDSLLVVFQLATTPQDSVPPGSGIRRWPTRVHLTLRDTSGRILSTSPWFHGMYTGLDERGDMRLPFSNRPFAAPAGDRVYFGSGDGFAVSYLDSTFNTAGEFRWPSRNEPLTTQEVERVRAEAIATISRRPLPPVPFAKNFDPAILPANRPSIGRVFVDRSGNLWIERFEAMRLGLATQRPGEQWSVLARDGRPIAILKLPPMTRLEDVRGNDVVVVRRDSLDVQSVAVHRLKR